MSGVRASPKLEFLFESKEAPHGNLHDSMDGGGTVPWTEPVEPSREQRPRATQEAKAECTRAT